MRQVSQSLNFDRKPVLPRISHQCDDVNSLLQSAIKENKYDPHG